MTETEIIAPTLLRTAIPSKEDNLSYNLQHLAAFDLAQFNPNIDDIKNFTRDNIQLLLNRVFSLPVVSGTPTPMVTLPASDANHAILPRALPLPKPKALSRWDKFAQEKGIVKKKRGRMVWDEIHKDWAPRWGADSVKKTADKNGDWLMEVSRDSTEDPFEKKALAKQLTKAKHKLREMRNDFEAAGDKMPAGVSHVNAKRGKDAVKESLSRAVKSTASMGKFDKKTGKEPKVARKTKIIGGNERDFTKKLIDRVLKAPMAVCDKTKMKKVGKKAIKK
jgi:regulator of ribosome biosynthesis